MPLLEHVDRNELGWFTARVLNPMIAVLALGKTIAGA